MNLLRQAGPCAGRAPALLVLLPGIGSAPAEFVDEGFVDALRRRGIAADVVVADSHFGYYADRSVFTRLREDIVLPARAAGYRQVWLVGISLGGFGALGYAVRHGDEISGVLALAPYLGPRRLLQEIGNAGGPRVWRSTQAAPGADEADREIWYRLAGPPARPPIYLGYGVDDRFVDANRVLGELLPGGHVATAPGGHDWPVWRELWSGWLDRGLLPASCTAAP